MKITIAGTGYVGLSNAVLLAQENEVIAVDINEERVNLINDKRSTVADSEIEDFLANKPLKCLLRDNSNPYGLRSRNELF